MKQIIDPAIVRQCIQDSGLENTGLASIRELNRLVSAIEIATQVSFIRMEMGIPGLLPPDIAVNAEIEALKRGVGSKYPPFDGIPELKDEISLFIRNFMGVDISPAGCMPTVGSMQGTFLAMMMAGRRIKGRDRVLFIDPGFPVNKRQAQVLGLAFDCFDIYDYRGGKLADKLESYLQTGQYAALIYSTPNNPSWICLNEQELQTIGKLCSKYDVIALEDLAYFGMDFRVDYSEPGKPPFIPTVAKYTDNCILLISSSKSFTLAGQRIGMLAVADALFNSEADNLKTYFGSSRFGYALIFGGIYTISAGLSHSAQWGLRGLLGAVNGGQYNFVENVREYGGRAAKMKKIFLDNGFHLVYDQDDGKPLADGFYFTVGYPGISGVDLVERLLFYGISAIALVTTGSKREGIRACVSLTGPERFGELAHRLKKFHEDSNSPAV
ncbi:MAG: pyridoxal phosphate-dependent aminotransferase [Desulfobacteraceae bacterium]|nr:pyridoxal phosphate-dependent aminotransferase [Desulfobacteraceae bacterium]